jgi:hypothetical protein
MRRLVLPLVVALLAAACTSDDPGAGGTETTASTFASGTTASPSPTSGPGGTIIVGGTDAVPDRPTPGATSSPAPVAAGAVGSGAPRYLRPSGSNRIVVQVIVQSGAAPRQATIGHIVSVLGDAAQKPVTTASGSVDGDRERWSSADIRRAAVEAADDVAADVAVVRLLFLRGRFDEGGDKDDQIIGLSVASDVAAIFSERVDDAATALVGAAHIEDSVTTHEVGHLLGLVDLFLRSGREDPDHPGHSRNRASVMYWAVESSLVTDLLSGGPPRDFDAEDRSDLARIAGG